MKDIKVVPYDLNWPHLFEEEAERIKDALGPNCVAIHHIGSTSVSGLASKPIIDILPVVKDITMVEARFPMMLELGYEAKGEFGIPFRRYFQKGHNPRTHQVHIFEEGSSEIDRHIKFRDWMRKNEKDRDDYAALKQSLAKKYPNDIASYCNGKAEFITSIDEKAGYQGIRLVMAMEDKEWEAYANLKGDLHPQSIKEDENHFHFVMYEGATIIAAAYVEFLKEEAIAHFISSHEGNQSHINTIKHQLEKWCSHHGKVLKK